MKMILVVLVAFATACGGMSQYEKREWTVAMSAGTGAGLAAESLVMFVMDGSPVRATCPPGPGACPETWNTDEIGVGMIVGGVIIMAVAVPLAAWLFPDEKKPKKSCNE